MNIVPQLVLNSVVAGAIYTMIALSFTLIFSVTKFFNLAHGVVAIAAAYVAFYCAQTLGWNLGVSIALGVLAAGLVGYMSYVFVFRSLLKRKASSLILLVASLGLFVVIQAVLALLFTAQFQNLSLSIANQHIYTIAGATITTVQLVTFFVGIVITALLGWALRRTQYGKSIVAISDDEEVSRIIGINTTRIMSRTFVLGSAIAGLGGILFGLDIGIEPGMGLPLLLKGIIAAIIGGLGNIYGAILGAFILGFVENFGIWKISGEWKDAIAFVLLILFLIFKPRGLIAK